MLPWYIDAALLALVIGAAMAIWCLGDTAASAERTADLTARSRPNVHGTMPLGISALIARRQRSWTPIWAV